MDLTLCKGTLSFPNMGVSFQTGATMVEAYSCLECLCQSSWLKLTEKHSQKHYTSCYQPNFPFGTSGRSRSSAIHQTQSSPSDYWGRKAWVITPETTFPLFGFSRALHHSGQRLALRIVILGLCAAVCPWKPIPWSPHSTVLLLMLLPECCNRG